jgi:hypothetical protein
MPLHEIVKTILTEYSKAKNEPLAGHPLGSLIRHDAAAAVKAALGELAQRRLNRLANTARAFPAICPGSLPS